MKALAHRVRSTSLLARVLAVAFAALLAVALLAVRGSAGAQAGTSLQDFQVTQGGAAGSGSGTDANATAFDGTATVGALFTESNGKLGSHFCTASVVQSTGGDLILTAAHCVTGLTGQTAFVPDYASGSEPYGVWPVTAVYTDQAWQSSRNPDDDFAFLRVASAIPGRTIESVTGAQRLSFDSTVPALVQVIGYPDGANQPIACTNWADKFSATQLVFDCGGYTDGTSGGPFLADVSGSYRAGTIIGVIGGYEQGGDLPQVSYAAVLGASASALFRTAEAAG